MKTVFKILLLIIFAIVVFMPMNNIAQWAYWSLFFLMFLMLYLYYRFSYWVSLSDVEIDDPVKFSVFCGKVPPIASEDLVRGRLIVTDSEVILFERKRERGTSQRSKRVWSTPIEDIERFSIGRVVGLRNGLILSMTGGHEGKFTISFMKNKKEKFTEALGWS